MLGTEISASTGVEAQAHNAELAAANRAAAARERQALLEPDELVRALAAISLGLPNTAPTASAHELQVLNMTEGVEQPRTLHFVRD